MLTPASPPDERRRLAALYCLGLLDADGDPELDRATRLAQRIFGAPIALVSLIDAERQWFASNRGLDATETPRDVSFCGHAILGSDPLVVQDATLDLRFADNPLVTSDPSIRFYAGAPIRSPDGSALGTLCVIDRKPREMSDEDLASLVDLAGLVEEVVAVRHLAVRDELTGLHNRRATIEAGGYLEAISDRLQHPIAVVFVDVNGLKRINDEHGHEGGDLAIRGIADALSETFADADLVARLGGDEFVVLITGASAEDTAEPIERFQQALRDRNATADLPFALAAAVGVVERSPGGAPLAEVIAQADAAMYVAKGASRRAP